MYSRAIVLACNIALLIGCAGKHNTIPRDTPITRVQLDLGIPDAISDESGSEQRLYVPKERPESEWPAEAPRTFFYLDRDLAVTFVLGKSIGAGPINPQFREHVLLPFVKRQRGTGSATHSSESTGA